MVISLTDATNCTIDLSKKRFLNKLCLVRTAGNFHFFKDLIDCFSLLDLHCLCKTCFIVAICQEQLSSFNPFAEW